MSFKRFTHKHFTTFTAATLALFLTVGLVSCKGPAPASNTSNADFENFTNAMFQQEVSSNTISLHYTLDTPDDYGILDAPVTFGSYDTNPVENTAALENCLAAVNSFDYQSLSPENRITYDVLKEYLSTALKGAKYPLYEEPLAPLTGIQSQLPVLLSEFRLNDAEDVDTYLALLSTTPEYFTSLINFEQAKSKAGVFMSADAADAIIEECQSFIDMGKKNYLYSSFENRVKNISSLSEKEQKRNIKQNQDLVKNYIFPAYQALIDNLKALRSTGIVKGGLCNLPDGKKYYQYVVRRDTGSSRKISELQKLTKKQMSTDMAIIEKTIADSPELMAANNQADALSNLDPSTILADLSKSIGKAFPSSPDVATEVKYVPEDMEEYLSPAFYLIPTIDNISENVIYINNSRTMDSLDLFTTLAHEGYPGHLYQTTYFAGTDPQPIRSILDCGGYVEGWATYAEMCSYYLAPLSKAQATLLQHNASVILGLYALADMGIHYDGWSLKDTISFFQEYGIEDDQIIGEIYTVILSDPANYLKYYIGYLEFLQLKSDCMKKQGDDFSQKEFHKEILEMGPAPFDVLRKYMITE